MSIAQIIRRFTKGNGTPVQLRSGNSAQWTGLGIGRTADEAYVFIEGTAGVSAIDSAAGDLVIRLDDSAKTMRFVVGSGLGAVTRLALTASGIASVLGVVRSQVILGSSPLGSEVVTFDLATLAYGAHLVLAEVWLGGATTNLHYRALYLFQVRSGNTAKVSAILASDAPGNNDGSITVTGTTVKCGWGGNRSGRITTVQIT